MDAMDDIIPLAKLPLPLPNPKGKPAKPRAAMKRHSHSLPPSAASTLLSKPVPPSASASGTPTSRRASLAAAKRRKPRPTSVISAANRRLQAHVPPAVPPPLVPPAANARKPTRPSSFSSRRQPPPPPSPRPQKRLQVAQPLESRLGKRPPPPPLPVLPLSSLPSSSPSQPPPSSSSARPAEAAEAASARPAATVLWKTARRPTSVSHPTLAPLGASLSATGGVGGSNSSDAKRKGLRHFAVRVCRKVEEKGLTTYNEVADELVCEERALRAQSTAGGTHTNGTGVKTEASGAAVTATAIAMETATATARGGGGRAATAITGTLVDEKNIRRRVYDSLNVLMAMQIIGKNKKLISWQGLDVARGSGSTSDADKAAEAVDVQEDAATLEQLRLTLQERRQQVEEKRNSVRELREQYERVKALVNKRRAEEMLVTPVRAPALADIGIGGDDDVYSEAMAGALLVGGVAGNSSQEDEDGMQRLYLNDPFLIIRAGSEADIKLTMDEAHEEVNFELSSRFGVFDDREILRRMPLLPEMSLAQDADMT